MSAPLRTGSRTPPGAVAMLLAGVALALTGSVAVQLTTGWQTRGGAGVLATAALALLALACLRRTTHQAVADVLLVLAALSVFGWVSALVTAAPIVSALLDEAPVPVAFLVVNSTKLASVAALAVIARRRRWDRTRMLVRVGGWNAPSGIPRLRWGVLGPLVIVAVLWLFLTDPAVTDQAGPITAIVTKVLAWAPVMLAGSALNAVCEELLYRHALVLTARPLIGTGAAVGVSCLIFGIGHITGSPGGWIGVIATAAYGFVCAAAMLQNRGMNWNLLIHVCGDLGAVSALLLAG